MSHSILAARDALKPRDGSRRSVINCARLLIYFAVFFLPNPYSLQAAEESATLKGKVEASRLNASPGRFKVRAVRPQKRDVQLGETVTDDEGRFRLTVDYEAVGIYGVILEATSEKEPSLALEAAVLRIREAKSAIPINPATTVEAAILSWKIRRHGKELEQIRPFRLFGWLRPMFQPKTRKGLGRAETALVQWARDAAKGSPWTVASLLRATVGDLRQIRKRLSELKIPSKSIDKMERMIASDAEVAYLLMMPYLLEL